MSQTPIRLLIAASGTGGHLFPAIATAENLSDFEIEWLGVPDRLERELVPSQYPLHTISVEGFQQRLGLGTLKILVKFARSLVQVRHLLKKGKFRGVFTTGGYIAAPAIIAARSLGLPVILHESNALPGKVTRNFSPWCNAVGLGFEAAIPYLPRTNTVVVGTPVRPNFLQTSAPLSFFLPDEVPVIVVVGGSQGAVSVNKLVREAAPTWFEAGAWVVHLTGNNDPDVEVLNHPQYIKMPFYNDMAALFQRATFAVSRAGAGTLTELAITHTPSILIPYPFAAEDHQTYNAKVFAGAGAAWMFPQKDLTADLLASKVLYLLQSPQQLQKMAQATASVAITNSAEQLGDLIRKLVV
ncbi:undecaprenyldiphospho-muramoylpentapeptide beta-N-acetylglucosaminyltransferase [Planktothrix agardhii]|uniref:UDP-N-acetylglucosamine--N-acetylmuramyl-(pentapeptide) pyrophosphoryl-undecaprenol N-acetylglucosamine transferase n=2 Tax=Planktothrix agardhii TaxID=1160 RepID=A0A073CHN5_PLAA1|nr:undecaprenyldiphospho-muramoylpentapeptide beta-N-acetylglucosaminyltransferase [Planktothrix agardhii]BBD56583.1 UDP-N-acetylglucosamine--N-acetylmuramyl-(pentapeptide) pyrophosphoryl-undecaprenol N-acetylglucosamine transferase [Planktothrix agardhii NIES-204]KEI67641.1 MurG [Planktothrix agardhii NIVA-CYA 126/8]MBG0746804.1 undecaprenyldiphospho-muramoylpentapeptide beta-N-acetylglucosaminyltransferase [Planktothrix agardhii KL2]MCB8750795.1 undecaprenyldiphospho-muramoylpentapeptide beta